MMVTSDRHAGTYNPEHRFLFGVALGLTPVVFMTAFGFSQCPFGGPLSDYTCNDPNEGWGGYFFLAAVAAYGVQFLPTVVCLFIRRVRPIAWGLLLMLLIAPILGIWSVYIVAIFRHPSMMFASAISRALSLLLSVSSAVHFSPPLRYNPIVLSLRRLPPPSPRRIHASRSLP
jgi:hypothetical protein